MKSRVVTPLMVALLVLGSACTKPDSSAVTAQTSTTTPAPPVPAQTPTATTAGGHKQATSPHTHSSSAHGPLAPTAQPGQPGQPSPTAQPAQPGVQPGSPPPLVPPPAPAGPTFTRPDALAACKQAEDAWRAACGCPMKVTIDLATYNAADDSETEEYFELAGKHFCEAILSGDDPRMPGNSSIGIAKFCKGRETDMCKISNFRVVHVPASAGFDCPVSGGTATVHANGLTRSYAYVCYKKVTSWTEH